MSGVIDLVSDDDDEAPTKRPSFIDMADEEDEDEDLKRAIALSLQDQTQKADGIIDMALRPSKDVPVVAEITKPTIGGLLNLDRKAMEAERLARLKRKRDLDNSEEQQQLQQLRSRLPPSTSARISPPPPRKQKISPTKSKPAVTKPSTLVASQQPPIPVTNPTFLTPQVLLTSQPSRFTSVPPESNTQQHQYQNQHIFTSISFPDILKPPSPTLTLKSVLLSSFIADLDWTLPHFNTRTTTFLLILHAQNAQHRTLLTADFAGLPNVKLVMPETLGAGNMHSKLMVLFYQASSSTAASDGEICRVVIPSANLIPQDWGVGGVMENVLFVVDLPLKRTMIVSDTTTAGRGDDTGTTTPVSTTSRFEKELKQMLRAMEVPDSVIQKLGRFDFSATNDVGFVYSRSGSALLDDQMATKAGVDDKKLNTIADSVEGAGTGTDMSKRSRKALGGSGTKSDMQNFFKSTPVKNDQGKTTAAPTTSVTNLSKIPMSIPEDPARTGLLSLQDTIVSLGLNVPADDPGQIPFIDYITSSLGNLTQPFIRQLFRAVCGQLDPNMTVSSSTGPKRANSKLDSDDQGLDQTIRSNLRIYFPAAETVLRSKGGPTAAGTICFQKKWWESNDLIRDCLHDCVGIRNDGILMHSKVLYVRFRIPRKVKTQAGGDKLYAGWAYVGSANLSESAWGRIVSDSKLKRPKLTCRNWESGVVIPVEVKAKDGNLFVAKKVEDTVGHQVSGDNGMCIEGRSSSHVRSENRYDGENTAPTSRKETMAKPKQGETGSPAQVHRNAKPCKPAVGDAPNEIRSEIRDDITHSSQQKHVNGVLEPSSLSEVFSGKIPVPVQQPSASHVARQQNPWFFMEE